MLSPPDGIHPNYRTNAKHRSTQMKLYNLRVYVRNIKTSRTDPS